MQILFFFCRPTGLIDNSETQTTTAASDVDEGGNGNGGTSFTDGTLKI